MDLDQSAQDKRLPLMKTGHTETINCQSAKDSLGKLIEP